MAEHKKKYSNDDIIAALGNANGLIFIAAKMLGCTPQTIYTRANNVKAVRDAIDNARGEFVDAAERKLMTAVSNGEPWAVSFTLKTLGKTRGYVERQEIRTWRDEVIELLKARAVTPQEVVKEVGAEIARELFVAAGIRGDEGRETYSTRDRASNEPSAKS